MSVDFSQFPEPHAVIDDGERLTLHLFVNQIWQAARASRQDLPTAETKDVLIDSWLKLCPQWMQAPGHLPVSSQMLNGHITDTLEEGERIEKLSNDELAQEVFDNRTNPWKMDLLLDELCSRVSPGFGDRLMKSRQS
jgi:hypothetical protein